jgi:hypothetical protein
MDLDWILSAKGDDESIRDWLGSVGGTEVSCKSIIEATFCSCERSCGISIVAVDDDGIVLSPGLKSTVGWSEVACLFVAVDWI